MSSEPLHLVQLRLDAPALLRLGRNMGLPLREVDEGYLIHCMLGQLFGKDAPRPFSVARHEGRSTIVLGYASQDSAHLARAADEAAEPEVHTACDWQRLASKAMPTEWTTGRRVGFEVRVSPVVRMSSDGDGHRRGAEVDAFLAACWSAGEGVSVDREEVYRRWLGEQVERVGGGAVANARMTRFRRARLLRRRRDPRTAHLCERPDATLRGTLKVTDPDNFIHLLARGVGRHRGFGFGMLLLRPAEA